MPVDPPIAFMLDTFAAQGMPGMADGSVQDGRSQLRAAVAMMDAAFPGGPRTAVGQVADIAVAGAQGPLTARVYHPADAPGAQPGPLATVVMFHGGGFVIGDIGTHDDQARLICAGTGAVVVSVDYRLAPEAPFPAGVEDCLAAVRDVAARIGEFGGDPGRLGVAGDSAGANLATVVAQLTHAEGGPPIAAQLLFYPTADAAGQAAGAYPSATENAEGYFLTTADMRWFLGHYLPGVTLDEATGTVTGAERLRDPRVSPLHGALAGLPPAVIGTAEFDPLRDEGEAYAGALEAAGVHVVARRSEGLIHGFAGMGVLSPLAQQATESLIADFAKLLG